MESFFAAALTAILIPYVLIFLVLAWNELGPALAMLGGRSARSVPRPSR